MLFHSSFESLFAHTDLYPIDSIMHILEWYKGVAIRDQEMMIQEQQEEKAIHGQKEVIPDLEGQGSDFMILESDSLEVSR